MANSPTPATMKYMIARTTENALIFFVAIIRVGISMTKQAYNSICDGLTSFISDVLNIRNTHGGSPNQSKYAETDDQGTQ